MDSLQDAASAHGYELWTREGVGLEVLAIPTAASHGTPQALADTFSELSKGLPRHPGRKPPKKARLTPKHGPRSPEVGSYSFLLDTHPPIELVFLN